MGEKRKNPDRAQAEINVSDREVGSKQSTNPVGVKRHDKIETDQAEDYSVEEDEKRA